AQRRGGWAGRLLAVDRVNAGAAAVAAVGLFSWRFLPRTVEMLGKNDLFLGGTLVAALGLLLESTRFDEPDEPDETGGADDSWAPGDGAADAPGDGWTTPAGPSHRPLSTSTTSARPATTTTPIPDRPVGRAPSGASAAAVAPA